MPAPVSIRSLKLRRLLGRKPVFFCWRRDDCADIAGRIYDRLLLKIGARRVIRDLESIPLGHNFRTYIKGAVPCCRAVVAVIGPNWLKALAERMAGPDGKADYVYLELFTALSNGVRVVPVLVGGARMPLANELPDELRELAHLQAIEIRADPDFRHDIDRLAPQL